MFQFRRFPTYAYLIQRRLTEYCSAGFPHSVIHGSTRMCRSPWLIAACHDLLRLLMPRHSPCALSSLTSSEQAPYPSPPAEAEGSLIPLLLLSRPDPSQTGPFASKKRGRMLALSIGSQLSENYAGFTRDLWLIVLPFGSTISLLDPLLLASHFWNFFLRCSVFKVRS